MSAPQIGHVEGGHSFIGGDPANPESWKRIGEVEDGHVFLGGDPAKQTSWKPNIDKENEADLGFVNRAKYSIEPIQSNRKALLVQEFGHENVLEDGKGDLFVKQDGAFVPVNKEGLSVADATDFLGATPEMAGGIVGTAMGAMAGAPTGGTASVPLAIATGAVGAGAGSLVRQGVSAALGTPQVATIGERATEAGLSAVMGGAASGIGTAVRPYAQKAKAGITQYLKSLSAKEAADTVAQNSSKTVAKTAMGIQGEITPIVKQQTAEDVLGNVADQSGREMVQQEHKNLTEIAAREGLPAPSYAQAAQGKAILAENQVMDMPLIGGKIRKQADQQAKLIRNNLEKITGRQIGADSDAFEVGTATKDFIETSIMGRKKIAQELYKTVEDEGANAMIGKTALLNRYKNFAADIGVIDPMGNPVKYDATSGLTEEAYNKLQSIVFQNINALKRNQSPKIRFEDANALTKTIKGYVQELEGSNPNAHRLLSKFEHELDSTMEGILNREAPKLGEKFRAAQQNWAIYKRQEKAMKKLIGDGSMDAEKVVKTIMTSTGKIDELKEVIGEDRVREMAKSYVADILFKVTKSGVGAADNARNALRNSAPQIKAALGEDAYQKIMDNLHYLNSTGRPLTITRASLMSFLDFKNNGVHGAAIKLLGVGKTVAESKGTTITKAVKDAAVDKVAKAASATSKAVDKASGGNKAAGLANLMGDRAQRASSSYVKPGLRMVSDKEDERTKRGRIISSKRGN